VSSWFISGSVMRTVKIIDLFIGVKAEQSLRDALRMHLEQNETDLELIPFGKKDWIAGIRFRSRPVQRELDDICRQVRGRLISLGSEQRVRDENVRLFAVPEPVPVFREPDHSISSDPDIMPPLSCPDRPDTATCPQCQRVVHEYNLHFDTTGRIVGCFMCGGFHHRQ
jgi:hypothetical protein